MTAKDRENAILLGKHETLESQLLEIATRHGRTLLQLLYPRIMSQLNSSRSMYM